MRGLPEADVEMISSSDPERKAKQSRSPPLGSTKGTLDKTSSSSPAKTEEIKQKKKKKVNVTKYELKSTTLYNSNPFMLTKEFPSTSAVRRDSRVVSKFKAAGDVDLSEVTWRKKPGQVSADVFDSSDSSDRTKLYNSNPFGLSKQPPWANTVDLSEVTWRKKPGPISANAFDSSDSSDAEPLPIECYVSSSDEQEQENDLDLNEEEEVYSDDGFIPASEDENDGTRSVGVDSGDDQSGISGNNDTVSEVVRINLNIDDFEEGSSDDETDGGIGVGEETDQQGIGEQVSQKDVLDSEGSYDDDVMIVEERNSGDCIKRTEQMHERSRTWRTEDTDKVMCVDEDKKEGTKERDIREDCLKRESNSDAQLPRQERQSQGHGIESATAKQVSGGVPSQPVITGLKQVSSPSSTKLDNAGCDSTNAKEGKAPILNIIDKIMQRLQRGDGNEKSEKELIVNDPVGESVNDSSSSDIEEERRGSEGTTWTEENDVDGSESMQLEEANIPIDSVEQKSTVVPFKGPLADLISSVQNRVGTDDGSQDGTNVESDNESEVELSSDDDDDTDEEKDRDISEDDESDGSNDGKGRIVDGTDDEEEDEKEEGELEEGEILDEEEEEEIEALEKRVETGRLTQAVEDNGLEEGELEDTEGEEEGENNASTGEVEASIGSLEDEESEGRRSNSVDKEMISTGITGPTGVTEKEKPDSAIGDISCPSPASSVVSLEMDVASDDEMEKSSDDSVACLQSSDSQTLTYSANAEHSNGKRISKLGRTSYDVKSGGQTSESLSSKAGPSGILNLMRSQHSSLGSSSGEDQLVQDFPEDQVSRVSPGPDPELDEDISFLDVEKNSDGTLNVVLKGDYDNEKLDELFEKPGVMDFLMSAAAKINTVK